MYVCICKAVTESQVRALGARGVTSPCALVDELGLSDRSACGRCLLDVERLIRLAHEGRESQVSAARGARVG